MKPVEKKTKEKQFFNADKLKKYVILPRKQKILIKQI
jgi:hypothetical protein